MKDKTKVKPKNVGKVAAIKAKNPHATHREIQKESWLAPATVVKATKELKQNWNKDETIAFIVGSAKNRLKRISKFFDRYVGEAIQKPNLSRWDVSLIKDIARDDIARITVLWWNVTDDEWWLKDITAVNFILWGSKDSEITEE